MRRLGGKGIQNNMRRLDEEVVHQHYCEANHKQGRLLSFDKLHTNLPSVHATDFQLDLRPRALGGRPPPIDVLCKELAGMT